MRTVVVLAGGLGSRVAHLTADDVPKAMLPIAERAFIDVKLAQLAAAGARRAVVLTGHSGAALEAHLAAVTIPDLAVECHRDGPRLHGTGGAVAAIRDQLPDVFWVTYGDTLVEAPLARIEALLGHPQLGIMTVLHNRDAWAPSNADIEGDLVVRYEKGSERGTVEWIDYGLLLLRRAAFDPFSTVISFDLTEPIQAAVAQRRLGAFTVTERFHDIGTEESWRETDRWARESRIVERLGI